MADDAIQPETSRNAELESLYLLAATTPSDINEHCETLRLLAQQCDVVVEFGMRHGVSTVALLAGQPRSLMSVDLQFDPAAERFAAHSGQTAFTFCRGSSLTIDIPECDLLFIDTKHTADQLWQELTRHSYCVRRWIALHDTEIFGLSGEDAGPGLLAALQRFLRRFPEWRTVYHSRRNHGLTVLCREPFHPLPFAMSDPIPNCLVSDFRAERSSCSARRGTSSKLDCYLTVYEQITWPKQMAEQCVRLGLNPILLDNGSTYEPLLEWLERCPYTVIRVGANAGCYGFWNEKRHHDLTSPYIVSDSDLDLTDVPDDAVDQLRWTLDENPDIAKVGLSLEIDDIPDTYEFKQDVLQWEKPYWTVPRGKHWLAGVGATFALYDPARNAILDKNFYSAIRLDRPYTARHLPWYLDFDQLSDELRFYYSRCDDLAYWGSRTKRRLQGINA